MTTYRTTTETLVEINPSNGSADGRVLVTSHGRENGHGYLYDVNPPYQNTTRGGVVGLAYARRRLPGEDQLHWRYFEDLDVEGCVRQLHEHLRSTDPDFATATVEEGP